MLEYATPRLGDGPGVRLVGYRRGESQRAVVLPAGHEPLEVGKVVNAEGIAVRAGHHCLKAVSRIAEGGANVG